MKKNSVIFASVAALAMSLTACGSDDEPGADKSAGGDKKIVMGFAQVGAESGWRAANTESIKSAATEAGIELKFVDGQQKQDVQISAIRQFIADKVDVIAFSPKVDTGWDTVLEEAKNAKIPVILTDRSVTSDPELYVSFIGSDFLEEGEDAGKWVVETVGSEPTNVVILEGSPGASAAKDRQTGFMKAIEGKDNIKILATQTGEFTRADGKTVMNSFLQKHGDKIDLLFAHNDDMGLGAIEAIKAAGLKPGEDIKIVTVDAVKAGMEALAKGEINYIVECSPLLGPQLMDVAKKVLKGEKVEKRIVTQETEFTTEEAIKELPNRKY